ncbi:uncharacterized protein [Amphiura filiformis]|uniref:uncharacterized protein isoform X2 n=1 Tax=Amphiura filiformis TaxID=82378 RepID=UPI003B225952
MAVVHEEDVRDAERLNTMDDDNIISLIKTKRQHTKLRSTPVYFSCREYPNCICDRRFHYNNPRHIIHCSDSVYSIPLAQIMSGNTHMLKMKNRNNVL